MAAAEDGTPPPTPEAPEVDPGEAAVLFVAGYSAEDIADMNPDERAAEAAEARTQGVEPIDETEAARRMTEHAKAQRLIDICSRRSGRPPAPAPPQRPPTPPFRPRSVRGHPTPPTGATPVSARPHAPDEDTGDVSRSTRATVKIDAARFQFKSGGDAQGVTDALAGVKEWDDTASGIALVWEDLKTTVDGHQRLGQAQRFHERASAGELRRRGWPPGSRTSKRNSPPSATARPASRTPPTPSFPTPARTDKAWVTGKFLHEEVAAITREMRRHKVTMYDLGIYLVAKHAAERNAVMAQRDPARFAADGGSGLSDQAAADLLAAFTPPRPPTSCFARLIWDRVLRCDAGATHST